jgi:diguanylate cyclase (GGDEF)-like protein
MSDSNREEELLKHIDELTRENERLQQLVNFDDKTGLPNARYLKAEVERRLIDAKISYERYPDKTRFKYGFLLFDLNNFKAVNDAGGHLAGDAILQNIAQTVPQALRVGDVFARLQGDEFGVIILAEEKREVKLAAKRLRQIIYRTKTTYARKVWQISASIGGTFLVVEDTFESAYERADQAVYQAKKRTATKGSYAFVLP